MSISEQFESCWVDMEHSGVRKRKEGVSGLMELLHTSAAINFLNTENEGQGWTRLLNAIQSCLIQDCDHMYRSFERTGSKGTGFRSGDLLAFFVRVAIKESALKHPRKLVLFLIESLKIEERRKIFENCFVKNLIFLLSSSDKTRAALHQKDWEELCSILHTLCAPNTVPDASSLKVYSALLKWGPLYTFPVDILREQFAFITDLSHTVLDSAQLPQKEAVVELLFEFCKSVAKDCRMSVCRLGEEIFPKLLNLYEGHANDRIKLALLDLFLLQVTVHNPKGVKQDRATSYAVSWNVWSNSQLRLYFILKSEVEQCSVKPTVFIKTGDRSLLQTFVNLFVDVARQVFCSDTLNVRVEDDNGVAVKKQRIGVSFDSLLAHINDRKSWEWIQLVAAFLAAYPDMITADCYVKLLKILASYQIDDTNPNLRHNVYLALVTLDHIRDEVDLTPHIDEIHRIWNSIIEATLRLHHNEDNTQKLLQSFIKRRSIKCDTLVQNYRSESVFNITEELLITLNHMFDQFKFLQSDNNLKGFIIRWILHENNLRNNAHIFGEALLSKTLIYLILKQRPDGKEAVVERKPRPFADIEDVYEKISLETLVEVSPNQAKQSIPGSVENNLICDQNLRSALIENVIALSSKCDENIEKLLHVTLLMFNMLSYLSNYGLEDLQFNQCFVSIVKKLFTTLVIDPTKDEEVILENIVNHVRIVTKLFRVKIDVAMGRKLRNIVPKEFLMTVFQNIDTKVKDALPLKIALMECLMAFSCIPDASDLLEVQVKSLECLVNTQYNCFEDDDCALVVTLLRSWKSCDAVHLTNQSIVEGVFNVFQTLCGARYECYHDAVDILDIFCEIYPLIFTSNSEVCKSNMVDFLVPFLERIDKYGPEVSIKLIKCIGLIFEIDPNCAFSRCGNEEIIFKLPNFLNNDHQAVRFAAIEQIARFFHDSSKTRLLSHFHRQEIMFSAVYVQMSKKLLEVEGECSNDRMIDETVTRSASVLQIYASIMLASNLWIGEALYSLLKIATRKNIDLSQVLKVLTVTAQTLGFDGVQTFLEKNLISLYNHWKILNLSEFPFGIFGGESVVQFYAKYWHIVSPHISGLDQDLLQNVANSCGKSTHGLLESSCPKILAHCIAKEVSDLENLSSNTNYRVMSSVLGVERVKLIFEENVDEVVLYLGEFLSDKDSFKGSFASNVIFSKFDDVSLSVEQFHESIQFIENTLFNGEALFSHIFRSSPNKIQRILLQLNLRLKKSQALDEKFRYFHVYTIISQLCIESVCEQENYRNYFLRDFTYTLLHLINDYKNAPELALVAARYFRKAIEKMLPVLAKPLENFLVVVISRLFNLSKSTTEISSVCEEILHLLLTQNGTLFTDTLKRLPNIFGIKSERDLEEDIRRFLYFTKSLDIIDECAEGLTVLEVSLSSKKPEMKALYEKLRKTIKFSEDCENSLLHQLIGILISLTCSANLQVRTGALRCLGEIGPADLSTLVLRPENSIPDPKLSPWELMSGFVISLVSKFIVDDDVNVVKVASEALHKVLESKSAKNVADSGADFGFGPIKATFLLPYFCKTNTKNNVRLSVDHEMFLSDLNEDQLWLPRAHNCHDKWITDLVSKLLGCFEEKDVFTTFIAVGKRKLVFCESLLPVIIFSIIFLNSSALTQLISSKIQAFFHEHWTSTVNNQSHGNKTIETNKASVQCMLNVVNFVRLQKHYREKKLHKHLEVDYLKVAKAAQFCGAHFTSLLYAELWCQKQISEDPSEFCKSTCSATQLDLIYERLDPVTERALQNILRTGYKAVGETDALLGCGTSYLLDPHSRIEHYKELGRWDQVIHRYESEVSHGMTSSTLPLLEGLKESNLYQISLLCSESTQKPQFESLWRLAKWDTKATEYDSTDSYHRHLFHAFKSLNDKDEFNFKESTSSVINCLLQDLSDVNLESSNNVYGILTRIQSIKEMEEFATAITGRKVCALLEVWQLQDAFTCNDFRYVEPIRTQRIILLKDYLQKQPHGALKKTLFEMMLKFSEYARIEGRWASASRTLEDIRSISGLPQDVENMLKFEEAQLCWSVQDYLSAKCILKQLCHNENVDPRLHSMAFRMTGKWMVERSSESHQTIKDYFLKSLDLIPKSEQDVQDFRLLVDTFDQLAKFSDAEYQHVLGHIKSDVFQKKRANMEKAKQSIEKVDVRNASIDLKKAVLLKKKQINQDELEIRHMEDEKDELLKLALKYYLQILTADDEHNISIFRLVSLLLENRNNALVKAVLERALQKIPTYKFITLLPQLLPHIAANDDFSNATIKIIEACAKDHPYHVLPLILALAFTNKDREYAKESKTVLNDARMNSARMLLNRLRKVAKLTDLIKKMESTSEAIIELAYYKVQTNAKENKDIAIPSRARICNVQRYEDVLVPTYDMAVSKNCDYKNLFVGIVRFGNKFQFVGGINSPKQIKCLGTDGVTRTQLVKGQDDLRQDAVMQQVFTIMNGFLSANKQTTNLLIRTYKVVPLSMRSGILEWVDNSMPLGVYLAGDNRGTIGAHEKYRPMDKSPAKSRTDFRRSENQTIAKKLRIFEEVCQGIKPIFHKFFEETFPQAAVWYERRRAYIHSVATTSMCGYILGIGDRHVSNILVDKSTAEVIHIDFGIAFEQGKVLNTPETVPFRLTRDVVDGMGVSGIEGVFRKSCEKTMEVLRSNRQTILTIVEVLLYDPLYDWTVSTAEAHKRQLDDESEVQNMSDSSEESASENVNVTAERALLRLRAKLQGTEDGKSTTVENQVGILIQQAMDASNLCRLFHGWQPYL